MPILVETHGSFTVGFFLTINFKERFIAIVLNGVIMRCVYLKQNEFIAYNDKVIGFFSDYRITANRAIDFIENRKLEDREVEDLLDSIDENEIEIKDQAELNETEKNLLKHITRFYPEIRYLIHGDPNIVLAADEEIPVKKEKKESKFSGFKNLLFKMYDSLEDPKTKEEREKLQKRLKRDWGKYKQNEKLYKDAKYKSVLDDLEAALEKGYLDSEVISLVNEIMMIDPDFVKELRFTDREPDISIWLKRFTPFMKQTNVKSESAKIEKELNDYFKDKNLGLVKLKIEPNIKNGEKRHVQLQTDWETGLNVKLYLDKFEQKIGSKSQNTQTETTKNQTKPVKK